MHGYAVKSSNRDNRPSGRVGHKRSISVPRISTVLASASKQAEAPGIRERLQQPVKRQQALLQINQYVILCVFVPPTTSERLP
jgi:hypothetical protein